MKRGLRAMDAGVLSRYGHFCGRRGPSLVQHVAAVVCVNEQTDNCFTKLSTWGRLQEVSLASLWIGLKGVLAAVDRSHVRVLTCRGT